MKNTIFYWFLDILKRGSKHVCYTNAIREDFFKELSTLTGFSAFFQTAISVKGEKLCLQ